MKNKITPFSFKDWQNIFTESDDLKIQKKEYRSYLKEFRKHRSDFYARLRTISN